jgi:hypothetical protein
MTDILVEFQTQAPEVVLYLSNILAKGVASGVGKDLWQKIKDKFSAEKDQSVIQEFELNPKNEKNQGKFEYLLENKSAELPANDLLEILAAFQRLKTEPEYQSMVNNSKNVVSNSTINVSGGNLQIGDSFSNGK